MIVKKKNHKKQKKISFQLFCMMANENNEKKLIKKIKKNQKPATIKNFVANKKQKLKKRNLIGLQNF